MKHKKERQQKRTDGRINCDKCGRLFTPSCGNAVCLLCQNDLIKPLAQCPQQLPQESKALPEKPQKKKKTKRVCLGKDCEREFMSEGIDNRLCPRCRQGNANISIMGQPIKMGEISPDD